MIRLVQRRLIVPRGDTGTFSIPILAGKDSGDAAIFTVFDPLMHRKIFEKAMTLSDGALGVDFTHNDTVNLPVGQYVWDIKFYTDPLIVDGKLVGGTEVDSYYSAFTLPICEIRETGDNLLMSDDAPTGALRPGQVDIITASIREITSLKENAAASAAEADTSATNAESSASAAATSAQDALDSKVAALVAQQTASAASENAASAAANAQVSATLAAQRADEVMVELGTKANIEDLAAVAFSGLYSDLSGVPTQVSQFINDAGYLTQHQDISGKANLADLATVATSGSYEDLSNKPTIPDVQINGSSIVDNGVANIPIANDTELGVIKVNNSQACYGIIKDYGGAIKIDQATRNEIKSGDPNLTTLRPIIPNTQHRSVFYGLAKAAGDSTQSISTNAVGTYTNEAKEAIQTMLDVPSKADVPTKISDLTDDSGHYTKPTGGIPASDLAETYLTQHQDISMKANSADLATVATSGSYEDLSNKPTIPDIQINWNSIVDNGIANIPLAANGAVGLVQGNNTYGTAITAAGDIMIYRADDSAIKNGNGEYKPIVPYTEHQAVFYGLAKAAGDTTQRESQNNVGIYTSSAKSAIQAMLDVPSTNSVASSIASAVGNVHSFDVEVVQSLPTQNIKEHTIYFVPKTGETNDVYDEYIYVNNAWEMIGNTQIDLSNYATKSEIPEVPVQDVQIDGSSIVNNGIVDIPIIGTNKLGIAKVHNSYGISVTQTKYLYITTAEASYIKAGINNTKPLTPSNQHDAVFYGLAKAAGDTTQSVSTNAVGAYTDEAKEAIQQMLDVPSKSEVQNLISISTSAPTGDDAKIWIDTDDSTTVQVPTVAEMNLALAEKADIEDIPEVPVQDVQINGTSILSSGVANIPIASNSTSGVIKTNSLLGFQIIAGSLAAIGPSEENIKEGNHSGRLVNTSIQHKSVFYGLAKAAGDSTQSVSTNAVGTYTDDAKSAIRTMLGAIGTTDYATQETAGIVKVSAGMGLFMSNGTIGISSANSEATIKQGLSYSSYAPVGIQHMSVFYGLSKAAGIDLKNETVTLGTYPVAAASAIKTMLQIQEGLKVVRLI